MARTIFVKSARKAQTCRVCSKAINIGDPYKWTKPRYKGKTAACPDCPIPISMTSSSKMVAVWEAQAALNRDDPEGVAEGLNDLAQTAREVGEEYQESADSQREVFPEAEVAEENEEKAQGLDGWADELESAASEAESEAGELEGLETEKADLDSEQNEIEDDSSDRADEIRQRLEELEGEIDAKRDEILAHLDEADNCPE